MHGYTNIKSNLDYSTQFVQIYARTSDCSGDTEIVVRCPPTIFSATLHAIHVCAIPFVFTTSALKTLNTVVVLDVIHNTQQQSSAMQSGDHDGRKHFSPFFKFHFSCFRKQ